MSSHLALVHPVGDETAPSAPLATVRTAPRRDPPFDDELPAAWLHVVGRHDPELPFPDPATTTLGIAPTRRADLPDPAAWTRRLLLGLSETAAGRRPLSQVAALLSPSIARGLGSDFERAAARGTRHWLHGASVRNVHVTEPSDGVAELAATVQAGTRVRALALRLEARHGYWRCTRLQLG